MYTRGERERERKRTNEKAPPSQRGVGGRLILPPPPPRWMLIPPERSAEISTPVWGFTRKESYSRGIREERKTFTTHFFYFLYIQHTGNDLYSQSNNRISPVYVSVVYIASRFFFSSSVYPRDVESTRHDPRHKRTSESLALSRGSSLHLHSSSIFPRI